jgi:adenine/guanine phosphoribosyltransferase-like PRPP-binding protein
MKKVVKKKKAVTREKIVHKIQSEYLGKVYGKQFLKLVPLAVKRLRAIKKKHPFDAIAFRGSSGAALAFPLSYFLKLPLIHVRKGESHYGSGTIEGTISSKRYIIVDDFIDRGTTVKKIVSEIKKNIGAKPVAIFLYSAGRYGPTAKYNDIPLFSF